MTQAATSPIVLAKRYGLVALAFLHIGVDHGLHGIFGVFFVAMIDVFGSSQATSAGGNFIGIISICP